MKSYTPLSGDKGACSTVEVQNPPENFKKPADSAPTPGAPAASHTRNALLPAKASLLQPRRSEHQTRTASPPPETCSASSPRPHGGRRAGLEAARRKAHHPLPDAPSPGTHCFLSWGRLSPCPAKDALRAHRARLNYEHPQTTRVTGQWVKSQRASFTFLRAHARTGRASASGSCLNYTRSTQAPLAGAHPPPTRRLP